jgi:topoisomerase-4 subunit A
VLEGFIIAFLNLDRVIDIIRYDDDPKAALMREDWEKTIRGRPVGKGLPRPGAGRGRTDRGAGRGHPEHAAAVSLRRLEEMELRAERDALMKERADLADLLESERCSGSASATELEDIRKPYGKGYRARRPPHAFGRGGRGRGGPLSRR